MPAAPRRDKSSSDDSSDDSSSSDDDEIPSTSFAGSRTGIRKELTLKDDEDTIDFQPPLPEDFGKMFC
jgi:hypothetical protein